MENEALTDAHTIGIMRKHSMHWVQQYASAHDWVKYGRVTANEYLMSVWVWSAESNSTKTTNVAGLELYQQTVAMMSDQNTNLEQVSEVTSVPYVQCY